MSLFCNQLSIHFGSKGILCYDLGNDGEPATSVPAGTAFSFYGSWLAIAPRQVQAGQKTLWRDPIDFPAHVVPYMLGQISSILEEHGSVERNGLTLQFQHEAGNHYVLEIMLDSSRKQYILTLAATTATDQYDAYIQTQEVFALLSDQYLPDTEIKINRQEAVLVAPLTLPNLSFRPDGTQSHTSAQQGLQQYGPYSRAKFRDKTLRVLVIGYTGDQGYLSALIHDLKNGMPVIQAEAEIWGTPWHETFGFKHAEFKMLHFASDGDETLKGQIEKALAEAKAKGEPYDVAIYEASETAGKVEAMLIQSGLPPHHLVPAELQRNGVERAQLLLDLALQLYAKAGGEPWLLPLPKGMEHELVIGIGSQDWADGVLGYATVFSSHGDYKLGQSKWNSSAEAWVGGLADFISQQLTWLSRKDGWQGQDDLKILFHLDERLSEEQIKNLKDALQREFGPTYNLQIAFLLLTYDHPHQLWNTSPNNSQKGIDLGKRFMPDMGTMCKVSADKYLLQCSDPRRKSTPPRPLLVELLPCSDDWGLQYMAQQVFYFAGMSWRSVHRATLPATLEYGKLVAGKAHILRLADPNVRIPEKLDMIPWYL